MKEMQSRIFPLLIVLCFGLSALLSAAPRKKATKPAARVTASKGKASTARSGGRQVAASKNSGRKYVGRATRWSHARSRYRTTRGRGRRVQPVVVARRFYGQQAPSTERMTEIQMALAQRGYLHSSPTGRWDQETSEALKRFQENEKIQATGKLNSLSIIALGLGPKRDANSPIPAPPPSSNQ